MDQNLTHRNHYIPRFYLKNWSLDGKTIQTYSILVSNSKVPYWTQQSIKNSAVWSDFYTRIEGDKEIDDFEHWFDREGKLLLHLTMPFEEKPKTYLPCDNLKYYRQRKQMTTRQLAEKLDIVPSTVLMYENGKHPIPYDVAIKLADVLEIEASLLYDDFSRFLSVPYTKALKSVRTALGLSQKAFAERIGIVPSYYYKIEEGNRRPSRKVYQKICAMLEATGLQTSLLWEHPLQ